jgi:hypothetical protein
MTSPQGGQPYASPGQRPGLWRDQDCKAPTGAVLADLGMSFVAPPRWGSCRSLRNEPQAMPGAVLEMPHWGVGQNNKQRRISESPENGATSFGACVGTVANAKRLMRGGLAELFLCSAPSLTYA